MKHLLKAVIILSILILTLLIYQNYFISDFKIKSFKKEETIEVFDNNYDDSIKVCYGNKIKCNKAYYKVKTNLDTKKIGSYNITYIIKYKNKEKTLEKKVNVVDTKKPTLEVSGDFNNVCKNNKITNLKISSKDNYDGDISNKVKYEIKDNKVLFEVKDSSNNYSYKTVDIIYNDKEKPTLILNKGNKVYLQIGTDYKEYGFTAIDNCDGDISKNVTVSGNVKKEKGTYKLTYKVKDSSGNEVSLNREVVMFEQNKYELKSNNGKVVYLTFDDGPMGYTEKLLNVLDKYNVKATFFVINTNSKYDYLIKEAYNKGHTIGLHSYTHKYEEIYSSTTNYFNDLNKISNKVEKLTGQKSYIMRFPGGSSNTISRRYKNGIMSELTKKVEEKGYSYFDWNISSGDAGSTTSTKQIVYNVTKGLTPNRVNMVLMHDIKGYSVDAVEEIIIYGLSNGYTFLPITEKTVNIHQNVNN